MSTAAALEHYKTLSLLAKGAAEVFGAASAEAIIAEYDRLEALQTALDAIFNDASHSHGLDDARVMRYVGVRYGYHLAAFEDETDLYVAGYDMKLRLRFVQRERDFEVL